MKKISLIALFFFGTFFQAKTQEIGQDKNGCGTAPIYGDLDPAEVPWYGNNAVLYNYLDQHAEYLTDRQTIQERAGGECPEIESPLAIPIKFWIWKATENEDPISVDDIQTLVDAVSDIFQANGLNFRFYTYCTESFVNADYVNIDNSNELDKLNNNGRHDPLAINVHIVISGQNSTGPWAGVYNNSDDFIAIVRSTASDEDRAKHVFSHELGHYFGLDHTFNYTQDLYNNGVACCKSEPVSRGKKWKEPCIGCTWVGIPLYRTQCNRTGDYLCDTDADPRGPGNTCSYTETWTDGYGETYHPNLDNIMSYYGDCATKFTNQQKGIMLNQIFTSPSRNFIYATEVNIIDPDRYEPDNSDFVGIPRLISVGESQCHSMSTVYQSQACDDTEDWLRIENENGVLGSYKVIIKDVEGEDNPVEDVFIFNTNNDGAKSAELTATYTDNGSERIWEVACSSMTPNTNTSNLHDFNDFLVQIVRGEEGGLYKVALETTEPLPTIVGNDYVCIGQSYTIANLPQGASVSWSKSSGISINPSSGQTTTVVNVVESDDYWLQARISLGGCKYTTKKTFLGMGGGTMPSIGNISRTLENGSDICSPSFKFTIQPVPGAVSYQWDCGTTPHFYGCYGSNGTTTYGDVILAPGQSISFTITVTAQNGCGGSATKSQTFSYTCHDHPFDGGGGGKSLIITPNPVSSDDFTLEIVDLSLVPTEYDIQILDQYGNLEYILESTAKIHAINSMNFLDGLHYAKVTSETGVVTKGFIIQN